MMDRMRRLYEVEIDIHRSFELGQKTILRLRSGLQRLCARLAPWYKCTNALISPYIGTRAA